MGGASGSGEEGRRRNIPEASGDDCVTIEDVGEAGGDENTSSPGGEKRIFKWSQ